MFDGHKSGAAQPSSCNFCAGGVVPPQVTPPAAGHRPSPDKPAAMLTVYAGSNRMRRMFRHTLVKLGVATDDVPIQVTDHYRDDGSVVVDGLEHWHVWALYPESLESLRDYPFCHALEQNAPTHVFHSQGTGPEKVRGLSRPRDGKPAPSDCRGAEAIGHDERRCQRILQS